MCTGVQGLFFFQRLVTTTPREGEIKKEKGSPGVIMRCCCGVMSWRAWTAAGRLTINMGHSTTHLVDYSQCVDSLPDVEVHIVAVESTYWRPTAGMWHVDDSFGGGL